MFKYFKLIAILILISNTNFARLPGDDDSGSRIYRGYALVYVRDENGTGVQGVNVMLSMFMIFNFLRTTEVSSGTTDQNGYVYITVDIEVPTFWGSPISKSLWTTTSGQCLSIVSSNNTSTNNSFWLYPVYTAMIDCDGNGINDQNEMPLAEKFCPTYILNSSTDYVRSEPVQYLGVDNSDLWFYLVDIQGRTLGDYPISYGQEFNPQISYFYGWLGGSGKNYASAVFDPTYNYTGSPPQKAHSMYDIRLHYNYAGNCNSENCWSDYYENERQNNYYPNTLYVHLFKHNQYTIIQYWSYYPYNDFINNHEGDWEHINVWVNSTNPSTASNVKVEYYFHYKYLVRYSGSFQADDATHPRVYVGGQNTGIAPGVHSGGNYPETNRWVDVTTPPTYYDEWVNGNGPTISYYSFYDSNPQDNYGLVILPDLEDIDYNSNPGMSWFKAQIPWGYLNPDSYGDWANQFIGGELIGPSLNVGNLPPNGPAYRGGWDAVGSDNGVYDLYEQGGYDY